MFGDSNIEKVAEKHNLILFAKLPVDTNVLAACDKGLIEFVEGNWLDPVIEMLKNLEEK